MVNIGDKLHPESLVKYLGIHVRPASPDGKQAEMRGIRLELPDETEIIGMEEKILRLYRRMLLAGHTNLPLPESSTGQQFIDAVKDFKPFNDAGNLTEEDLASLNLPHKEKSRIK